MEVRDIMIHIQTYSFDRMLTLETGVQTYKHNTTHPNNKWTKTFTLTNKRQSKNDYNMSEYLE